MTDAAVWVQLVIGVATALGTPSITYGVMRKMAKDQVRQLGEITSLELGHIKEKIDGIEKETIEISCRQKELRETVLPEKYVRRDDCRKCKEERQTEDQRLHDRISGER